MQGFSNSFRLNVISKTSVSWRLSVDGRRNRANEAAFQDFFDLMWTGRALAPRKRDHEVIKTWSG